MLPSPARLRARRIVAAVTAFCFFWSSVLPAQTIILPDGHTATQVGASGGAAQVTTATVRGKNAFNSFSRFSVGAGDTVNLHLPSGTQNLLNLVHDERTQIDGVLNSIRNGNIGGNVYLANPHGVVVGAGGVVNTGALHLSTPTQAFMKRFFDAPGEPSVSATAQLLDGSLPIDPDGLISIRGTVNTIAGAELRAGAIDVAGTVRVDAPAPDVFANAVNLEGLDSAQGVTVEAGRIALAASRDVAIAGTISAEGRDGVDGGGIDVRAGGDIALTDGARVSASGRGADSDGGRVVVLADRETRFARGATLAARGGDGGGDGGFIELSARQHVALEGGFLDAGALRGTGGDILLDPPSFTLKDGSASPSSPGTLTFSGKSLTLDADDFIKLENFTLSTRTVNGSGNSTADSGDVKLTAGRIEIVNSKIHTFADGGFKAGKIELIADGDFLATAADDFAHILIRDSELFAQGATAANGGKLSVQWSETDALPDPFVASVEGRIDVFGSQLKAGSVDILADVDAGYVFDHENAATVVGEDDPAWDTDVFLEDFVDLFADARMFVGVVIAKTDATVNLGASAPDKQTSIEADGAINIKAESASSASVSSYGIAASIGYANSHANATVDVGAKTKITGGGPITVGAYIDNNVDVVARVVDPTEKDKGKVPVDIAVAYTTATGTASTTVGSGVEITGNASGANDKVTVEAVSSKDLSTEVGAGAGNDLFGGAVAITHSDTRATTTVNGRVTSQANLDVKAVATTDGNDTSAESAIGDSLFEYTTEDLKDFKYSRLNKTTVLQALVEKIGDRIAGGTEMKADSGTGSSFVKDNGVSAAVAIANHRNEAHATVGAGADLEAKKDLAVLAKTEDRQTLSSTSEVAPSRSDGSTGESGEGDKKNALAAAVLVANFDNVAQATAAGTTGTGKRARLDALGTLSVKAETLNPYEVNWAPLDQASQPQTISGWLNAIPGSDLGIPDTFFNTWAQAAAEGEQNGIAGSVNVLDIDNTAQAVIGDFTDINQDTAFFGALLPGDVEVKATSEVMTVNLSGVAEFFLEAIKSKGKEMFSTGGDKSGVGGVYLGTSYTNNVHAAIADGAQLDADDLDVEARTKVTNVSIAVAGAKAGKYGFGGSFSNVDIENYTTARIGDGAVIDLGGSLSILADDYALDVNTAGGVAISKNVGVGAAVVLNDIERDTRALIGLDPADEDDVAASGSVTADGAVTIGARTDGSIWTVALAGAVKADDEDTPTAQEGQKTDPETDQAGSKAADNGAKTRTSTNKGSSGLHISADVAINDIEDQTRAYIDGGGKVTSGSGGVAPVTGEPLPSLQLTAANDSEIWALGGAITLDLSGGGSDSGTSVGLAGSFALNNIGGATEAYIKSRQPIVVNGDAMLSAARSGGIRALTASVAGSTQKSGLEVAGNVALNELDNTTAAWLEDADLDIRGLDADGAAGSLALTATDTSTIYSIAGAATLGGKGGFGATIAVNEVSNETKAYSRRSRLKVADSLSLFARNSNDIRALGASLGAGKGQFELSGVGVANTFDGQLVEAFVDNTDTLYRRTDAPAVADFELQVLGDVSIVAEENSEIETVAAAAGASKGGGIGASVAVNRIVESGANAYARNVVYDQAGSDFTLEARSLAADFADTKFEGTGSTDPEDANTTPKADSGGIRVIAGGVGFGKGVGAGVAIAVNRLSALTDASIRGASTDITARNVIVEATGEGSIGAIGVGVGVATGSGVGIGGSVIANYIGNQTTARIDGGARVEGRANVGVIAQTDDRISVAAGSAGIGLGGLGLGATVTVNQIDSSTTARIGDAAGTDTRVLARTDATPEGAAAGGLVVANGKLESGVDLGTKVDIANYAGPDLKSKRAGATKAVTGVAVNAMGTQHIENIDVNVSGGKVAFGAAVNVNLIRGSSVAEILNADINQGGTSTAASNQQVDVTAGNVAYGNGFIGNVSVGMGAAGAGVDTHVFARTTRANVTGSAVGARDTLGIHAEATQGASSLVVGAAVGGVALVGSGAVVKYDGTTEAYASKVVFDARRIAIGATSEDHMHVVGGALAAGGGTAASGTFALGINDAVTRAYVDGGTNGRSSLWATDGISVVANGLMDITTYAVGGSLAGGVGIAGVASVNLATSSVEAYVEDADIGADVGDDERRVGGLAIAADGEIRIRNIAGGVGVGGTAGVGAGASVNVLKNRVSAWLAGSTVKSAAGAVPDVDGAVTVTAHSKNDIDATAVMAGVGGTAGIGGAAVVTLMGDKPDADANSEADKNGSGTLSKADEFAKADRLSETGDQDSVAFSNDDRDGLNTAAKHDVKDTVNDTENGTPVARPRLFETRAAIEDSVVDATQVEVKAQDESAAKTKVGGLGVGTIGFGGAVGYTQMRSNVSAIIDGDSTVTAKGSVAVRALATPTDLSATRDKGLVDIQAIAGGAGLVGLGAAVAIGKVDNVVEARVDGDVTAGSVTIEAADDTKLDIQAIGAAAGALAAGASIGRGTKTSQVTAATGDETNKGGALKHASITTTDADEATPDGAVSIAARSAGKVAVDVTAAAGGLGLGAAGADARATDTSTVTAKTGIGSLFDLGTAALGVTATAETAATARANGVGLSLGGGIGVSIARATASATVAALLGARTDVTAGALALTASQVRRVENPALGPLASASSYSSGSGGGLLFGVNASNSEAVTGSTVTARILEGTLLDIGGDVGVFANADGVATATVSGLAAGLLAVGANDALAKSTSTTTAKVAAARDDATDGTAIGGTLIVQASGADGTYASATAGAGGIIAGAAAKAETSNVSTTLAQLESAPIVDGRIVVRAQHRADFNGLADSTSASLFGASGGRTGNTVLATVDATIAKSAPHAPAVNLRAGGLTLAADNAAYKISNGFDLTAGAGGLLGGAAARTFSGVNLITRATFAPDAIVRLRDPIAAGGGASVSAVNRIGLSDRVKLDAGGAIAVARAESEIVANLLSQATLGANALLDSIGDVYIAAGNQGSVFSSANAKTYGLAGAAQGHSRAVIDADGIVSIAGGARIRSDGNIALAAGRDANGAADSLSAVARTDLYNKTVFPVETNPDADAVARHDSVLDIAAGARVDAARDIQLVADRGTVVADGQGIGKDMYREIAAAIASFFSNLFGGDDVNLDIHGGSSFVANNGVANVDGNVTAGYQHARRFEVDAQGNVLPQPDVEPIAFVETDEDLIANLFKEYQRYEGLVEAYSGNDNESINVRAAYEGELSRIRRQLADLGFTGDPDDAIGGLVPVDKVPAKFLNLGDIRARGGDVAVVAGALVGRGSLSAPGNASIHIENMSDKHLRLDKLVIEDAGGKLSFNGALVGSNADIARRNVPVAGKAAQFASIDSGKTGEKPVIEVLNGYLPPSKPDGSLIIPPDIQITDDIINPTGNVTVKSLRGNVVLGQDVKGGPKIIADTIDIEAGNDFIQPYQDALYNIGGQANDPTKQWDAVAKGNEADPLNPENNAIIGARPGTGSIIAGNNVYISARILNINGTVQSGIADWGVTLKADLNDEIDAFRKEYQDALAAGETPASSKKQLSAFVNDPRGTIGAFYDAETDLIELEGVRVRGGYMQLFGDIISTGGGRLKVIDGYGRINVTNDTNRELVVNGLDTGNGIEGTLLITDTSRRAEVDVFVPKTNAIEKRSIPVTTRYTRIGDEMRMEQLVLFNGEETLLDLPVQKSTGRLTSYDIVDGKRYVWTTGLDRTTRRERYQTSSTVFGFIPSGNEDYTRTDEFPLSAGPLPLGDFAQVEQGGSTTAPDYAYEFDKLETDEEKFTGRATYSECTVWFLFCIERTYTIKDTFVAGSRDFHTHSVKADHDIGIEFIGTDQGVLAVNSDAGIRLSGLVRNSTGAVELTAEDGAITSISEFGAVRGTRIDLQAKTGIGGIDAPVVTEAGNGPVSAVTATGDVVLATRDGDLVIDRVATGAGEAVLSADGNLRGTAGGTQPHVSARRIELASALGGIGAEGAALRIAAGASDDPDSEIGLPRTLSASAPGSIFLTQTTGDLNIDSVVSGGGDVSLLALGGNIRDGNTHDTRDTRAEAELLAQWDDMRLLGDGAEQSKADTIEAFKEAQEAAYERYWQQRREQVRTLNAKGEEVVTVRLLAYDPNYRYSFSADEIAQMKAQGVDDAGIQSFADARTREYHQSHVRYGAGSYNKNFAYEVTTDDLTKLDLERGYKWTIDDLRYGQNLDVLNRTATDTETVVEAPNVSGRNVTLIATAGSVGTERDSKVIDGNRVDDESTPDVDEGLLTREERIWLSAAEVDDIAIDEAAKRATIVQREDIDVVATGAIRIEGRNHVYLGGEQDLNIRSVQSNGPVRIKGAEGIFDVSTDAAPTVRASGLIVEAAHGDIGATGDPLRIALADGTALTARAGGSIFLDERLGDLRVASVLAKGTADLSAQRAIIDARGARDSVAINAAAIRLSSRTGDVGSPSAPFSLFASTGAFGGAVAGGVYATTPTGDLRVSGLRAGGDVQLRAPRSLLGVGTAPHVTGARVDLIAGSGTIGDADQFFSVDSNGQVVAKAVTGLWFEEWNGDLNARDIGTRSGPLKIRVRNGNALFDNLFSDDVLDFDLAGGSLVVGYLEADSVDLTVRQEGATLLVRDMRIADGARLRADRILLPKLVHTGALDTLLLDLRGNDGGIADFVDVDIESSSPVTFTSLGTKVADIFSSSRELSLLNATITERGDIRHPANSVIVDNLTPRLVGGPAQLFTDGDPFFLALAEAARIQTDALIVSYDDNFVVNAFSTENSVMRMTQKTMAVQDNVAAVALQGDLFGGDTVDVGSLIDLDQLESQGFWQVPGAGEIGVTP